MQNMFFSKTVENSSDLWPLQWPGGSALKAGRRYVPGSIPGRTCRPSLSEFSVVLTILFIYLFIFRRSCGDFLL